MKTTWQLLYQHNLKHWQDPALQLINQKSEHVLRCWVGEISTQLLLMALGMNRHQLKPGHKQCLQLNKHQTQQFLMAACFHYQACLHQYQVLKDLRTQELDHATGLADILLYIRMSDQHPSSKQLAKAMNQTAPQVVGLKQQLKHLEHHQLIQKLTHKGLVFFDKNPLPHKHLFDPDQQVIIDYQRHLDTTGYEPLAY